MLLPALVASASGYLAFVAVNGTTPLFEAHGAPPLSFADLAGAVAPRDRGRHRAHAGYAWLVRRAKWLIDNVGPWIRIVACGLTLAALFAVTWLLTDQPLAIGIGYHTIEWALDPGRALWLVIVVFVVRCLANVATVAGSGVGGLFIPLVVAGALLGRMAFGVVGGNNLTLFVVIGVAAFLGAGYRVPLAAVMFVAETTGRPGFVVPGLLAAVAAMLVMGRASVTVYQRGAGAGRAARWRRPEHQLNAAPPRRHRRTTGLPWNGEIRSERRAEGGPMFIQVISGKVTDVEAMERLEEKWERDLRPGATGFLGATMASPTTTGSSWPRGSSRPSAAKRNSDRPEQDAWWQEMAKVTDDVTVHDCSRIETLFGGGNDEATFVQVMQGRVNDRAKAEEFFSKSAEAEKMLKEFRPDVIGEVIAIHDDGDTYSDIVYFSSEEEARAAEAKGIPDEVQEMMAEMESAIEVTEFLDLKRLTLR